MNPRLAPALGWIGAAAIVAATALSSWMAPLGRAILAVTALMAIWGVAARRRAMVALAGAVGVAAFAAFTLSVRRAGAAGALLDLAGPAIWIALLGGACLIVAALLPARRAG